MNRRSFLGTAALATAGFAVKSTCAALPSASIPTLTAVNVGFGDTAVLRLGDRTVMIDCYQEEGFGESFISHLPGRSIDVLFLTHRHFDHYKGIAALLKEGIEVRELWQCPFAGDLDPSRYTRVEKWEQGNGREARALVAELARRGTRIRDVDSTSTLPPIGGGRFEVLNPTPEILADPTSTVHDACLILRLATETKANAALFLADATLRAQDRVFRTTAIEQTGILWTSHHGGLDSVHAPLLGKAGPEHTIVSSRPGFHRTIPEPESFAIYQRFTRKSVRRTYADGSIVLPL